MFPKRGAIALVTTALALVLLLQFKTPADVAADAVVQTDGSGSATTGTAANSGSSTNSSSSTIATPSPAGAGATATPGPTATTPAATSGSASASATTVTGSVVSTRYGNVEVQVTVQSGKITDVQAIELPSGGRSGQISSYAAPVLASEALTAQSANIDIVSGATYTSGGYAQSLQAALDQAGIDTTQVSG
jgi:uncharacterized protein with FMN-binding domain